MTNKLFFIIALLGIFSMTQLYGQARVGLRLEYGLQSVEQNSVYAIQNNDRGIDYSIAVARTTPSQSIGLYTYFDFGILFFQPEVLYTSYSVQYELENFRAENAASVETVTESVQQFDFPIYAGVQYKFLRVGAGPILHMGQRIESNFANYDKINYDQRVITAGVQMGIGVQFDFVSVDLKYQREFTSVSDHVRYNEGSLGLDSALQSIRLGLAFSISK